MRNDLFSEKGFVSGGILNLSPRDAWQECIERHIVLVDVRESYLTSYKLFDVPEVVYLPLSQLPERLNELPFDKPLILADSAGIRSHEAMLVLVKRGYANIANLAGGLVEWERDELPLKTNISERLEGACACKLRRRNKQ